MIIKLSEKEYSVLKGVDLSEMGDAITFHDKEMTFETSDIRLLQILLNEEIVTNGMIDQNEVSKYGRELYDLYDSILDQL